MRHLSLFNGIGGFQLAAHWCGWQNVAHVEIDDFCNKVVGKHFPQSKCYKDIREFDGTEYRDTIDIISGGFPCQPYSVAGKRLGKKDDRALWPEMLRVIKEVRPAWVCGENVTGILSMGFEHYVSDLESESYEVQCIIIPACAVNAPHRRDRVWIVGYSERCGRERITWGRAGQEPEDGYMEAEQGAVANNDVRQLQPGNQAQAVCESGHSRELGSSGGWRGHWLEAATTLCRVDDGVSGRMDRGKRLRVLGNAIVPQVAYQIFKAIDEAENLTQP